MTNREYFQQALWLDRKISSYRREVERLRDMMTDISAPVLDTRVQTTRSREAGFVRAVEKLTELEDKICDEIDVLISFQAEMRTVIDALPCPEEQAVLRCRYLCRMTWEDIGREMNVTARTVRRWHDSAIAHAVQPKK